MTNVEDIISSFKDLKYNKNAASKKATQINTIPEKYKEIYGLLGKKSMDINEISRKIEKPINETNSIAFMMELEEYIEKNPDGTYKQKEW